MKFIKNDLKEIRTIGIRKDNFYKLLKMKNIESFEEFLDKVVSDDATLGHNGNREAFIRVPRAIIDSLDIDSITSCRELSLIGYCFTYRNLTGYNVLTLEKLNELFGTNKKRMAEFTRDLFKKFTTDIIKFTVKRSKGIILEINETALISFCEKNDGIVIKKPMKQTEIKCESITEEIEEKEEKVLCSGKPVNFNSLKELFGETTVVKESIKPLDDVDGIDYMDAIEEAPQDDTTKAVLENSIKKMDEIESFKSETFNEIVDSLDNKKDITDDIVDKNSIAYMMIHQWDNDNTGIKIR